MFQGNLGGGNSPALRVRHKYVRATASEIRSKKNTSLCFDVPLGEIRVGVYGSWNRGSRLGTVGTMKRLMVCEEKGRLLDAYVTVTDRQAKAVKSLSDAAKDNRTPFREALAHAEQARQDAEEARLALHLHSKTHGC
jgi:hypothetical protein